jgi:DNA-binding transcriptional LysR family regulator
MWTTVELRGIRTFLALAEELHFGRTAERLSVTPSNVSQTIRTLEAQTGGRLFDRTSRRVRLTPLGEQLQASARPAYEQLEHAFTTTREAAVGVGGTLRLGMYSPVSGGPHLVRIISAFRQRYPRCEVRIVDIGLDRNPLDWLRDDETDMLATRLPISDADVAVGPVLARESRIVAVASTHPLAERESICAEDLADYAVSDVPSMPRETIDAFIPPRTPSGRLLRRIPFRSTTEPLVRVALGEVVHPTVPSYLDHHRHPGVVAVPIRDLPPSETALVWLRANHSPKLQAFVRTAADTLAQAGSAGTSPPPRPTKRPVAAAT